MKLYLGFPLERWWMVFHKLGLCGIPTRNVPPSANIYIYIIIMSLKAYKKN